MKNGEELALTLNVKKKKLCRPDFLTAGRTMKILEKTVQNTIDSILEKTASSRQIENSFLSKLLHKDLKFL